MSGSNQKSGKHRHLSDEEAELWNRVADSATPLGKARNIVPAGKSATSVAKRKPPQEEQPAARNKVTAPPLKKPVPKKSPPPLAKFDNKKAKKIARGKDEIDAKIDLHGMRQAEAHGALRSFLMRAQSRDQRNVLVITGKGTRHKRDESDWFDDYEEPGVLRRNLPIWLAEPDLRAIVVSFTEAHVRHGGSGAFYVRLRKASPK